MAKAKTKKAPANEPKTEPQSKLLDPKAMHELLGILTCSRST